MHDFYLANEILKAVLDYASENGFKSVSKVRIELGNLLEHGEVISPENLIYNFKSLVENTIAKNAELKVKKIQGENWKLVSIDGE